MWTRIHGLVLATAALSACGGRDRDDRPSFPIVVAFQADQTSVPQGGTVRLTYEVQKASSVSIEPGVLDPSTELSGVATTGPLEATTAFTLVAKNEHGETTRTLTVAVQTATAAVRIVRFEAAPQVVAPGGTVTLSWSTENAASVALSEVGGAVLLDGAPATGSMDVTPAATTTFRLIAQGEGGPVQADVEVLVGAKPTIDSFTATPQQIIAGDTSRLAWEVRDAETVMVQDDQNNVVVMDGAPSGSFDVSPQLSTVYTLVASSAGGNAVANVTVEVVPPGNPRILQFDVQPGSLAVPGDVTVSWDTADADTLELLGNGAAVAGFPRTASGTHVVSLTETTVFELRAENAQGVATDTATVAVGTPDVTPPAIDHTAAGNGQPEGAGVLVSALITDAESAIANATLFYRSQGQATFSSLTLVDQGSDRYEATIPDTAVVPPAVEYYLQADDAAGNSALHPAGAPASFHAFTVTPDDQAPPVIAHTPVPNDQIAGQPVTVSADVTDASGVASVTLYYKRQADALYTSIAMTSAGNTYTADIPAASVAAPGVDYYLEASDTRSPANLGREPANAPQTVHSFAVIVPDTSAPSITHTPIANGQPTGVTVSVGADVTDSSGVQSVTLFYRAMGGGAYSSVTMSAQGASYSAQIPAGAVTAPGMQYYLEAADTAGNTGRAPQTAPATPYSFTVAPADTAPPSITHTPVPDGRSPNTPVVVTANVTDGSGVQNVTLFYRTRGTTTFSPTAMTGGPSYSGTIPAGAVQNAGVEYYLRAVDASPNANAALEPAGAPGTFHSFDVGTLEVEPNDTPATATPLLGPGTLSAIGLGAVQPAADVDYWSIDVPAGDLYTLRFELTSGGLGACPSPTDTVLRLYDTNGTTILVTDDFDGPGSCSLIDPLVDSGARALSPGRYYVSVVENGSNATVAGYELRASMAPAACGNGILESPAGEQCDDANVSAGDGCSAACQIEPEGSFNAPGGTLTGDVNPAGDTDLYAVAVGAGQFLTAELSDGSGGCPGNTVLELYAPDGVTFVGSDDDDGPGACSRIDPLTDAFAASMQAGTYYLRVRAASPIDVITGYSLAVTVADGVCGNSAVEPNEQCDDGNQAAFDGCSATCRYETEGTASGAGASFSADISPVGNVDYFAVVVPDGYSVRVETFAPVDGVCDTQWDTVVDLLDTDRSTVLVSDDEGGLNHCSVIDPATDTAARNLPAGTYWITVEDWLNNSTIPAYVLNVQILAPSCGDGFVSGVEECDDGGAAAGDGCSATCTLEGGTVELEPNDAVGQATALVPSGQTSGAITGALQTSGDTDIYRVVVGTTSHLLAEVSDGAGGCPVDNTLRLLDSAGTTLVSDFSDGPGSCGRLSPGADSAVRNLAPGTYYLEVSGAGTGPAYRLDVTLLSPGCGDYYLEVAETCDDGNTTAGDGCSATCQLELLEVEPNDTATAAQNLGGVRLVSGSIQTAGDADWYSVTVPAGGSLQAGTSAGAPDQCGFDSVVTIFESDGVTEVAEDDLDGPSLCSLIYASEASNLPAGDYFVRVEAYSSSATFDYVLTVDVN